MRPCRPAARVIEGDLTTDLPALAAEAPRDATLVSFHTAVLAYVPAHGRRAFREALTGRWIASEVPRVLDLDPGPPSLFALTLDGRLGRLGRSARRVAQLGVNSSASRSISSPSCHVPSGPRS